MRTRPSGDSEQEIQLLTASGAGNASRRPVLGLSAQVRNAPKEGHMFEGLLQPMHLLVIFGIALLVFGPRKLPELGKGIGEGIRGFKSAMKEEEKPEEKI